MEDLRLALPPSNELHVELTRRAIVAPHTSMRWLAGLPVRPGIRARLERAMRELVAERGGA